MRRAVFIDSWAWIAVAIERDPDHDRAADRMLELRDQRAELVTSKFVLAESLTRLRYDQSLHAALGVAEYVTALQAHGRLEVVVVDDALWGAALDWFRRYDDQVFSFIDCTSFAIMHDRGIQEALTNDRHFATAGFTPVS